VHTQLVNMLTPADVAWACTLMARLADRQWHDAFRAAGYDTAAQQRFVAKLKAKIHEGLASVADGLPATARSRAAGGFTNRAELSSDPQ
jgi:hypothetical protein